MAEPSAVRRQLAGELARLRGLAKISGRDMAPRIGVSQPTVSRIERATTLPSLPQVRLWLDATEASEDTRNRVLALTESAHTETATWRDLFDSGTDRVQAHVRGRETEARVVSTFEPRVVPSLLQTADYTRALINTVDTAGQVDLPAMLTGRATRQRALHDPGREFRFLVPESMLYRQPGSSTLLAAQLDHLVVVATWETVTLGVIPRGVTFAGMWHNFVVYDPADEVSEPYVSIELTHGLLTLADHWHVELYRDLFARLWDAAVFGDDAVALIRRAFKK